MSSAAAAVDAADAHPLVDAARTYAEEVLRPHALRRDLDGVDGAVIDDLRRIGLLGAPGPDARSPAVTRRLHEVVSGACFNTWLVWAQHSAQVARLDELVRSRRAQGLAVGPLTTRAVSGEVLLGAGVSDVRRYPRGHVAATRTPTGWRFDGTLSWVSGHGLNEAIGVDAVDATSGTVISAIVPAAGLRTEALGLAAVAGSHTDRVHLDGIELADDEIVAVLDLDAWRRRDLGVASDARSHHFGLAQTVLAELAADDHGRGVAEAWAPQIAEIRATAYALADASLEHGPEHRLEERLATKVASADALGVLTRALLAARSGRGLASDDTAQLHARSALFVLVQGQTTAVKAAQLDHHARLAAHANRVASPLP